MTSSEIILLSTTSLNYLGDLFDHTGFAIRRPECSDVVWLKALNIKLSVKAQGSTAWPM